MAARLLNALFASRCAKCGQRIEQGASAWYDKAQPKGRRTTHEVCGQPQAANAQGQDRPQGQPQGRQFLRHRPDAQQDAPAAPQDHAKVVEAAEDLGARFPKHKHVYAYDDVEGLLRATEDPKHKGTAWQGRDRMFCNSPDWLGLAPEAPQNLADVARIIRQGWDRGAQRIQEALDGFTVNATPKSIRRTRTRRDFGAEVDVTEYWRGRADVAWTDCTRAARPARLHYTIVNDAIQSGAADADSMFWRGAAVVALADKLTAAGYSVRVVSAWSTSSSGGLVCYTVCKPYDAPVDVPTLAASCANPAFFRAVGHSWGNGHDSNHAGHAHGYIVDAWPTNPGEILASNAQHWDEAAARKWVEEKIAAVEAAAVE